ADGGWSNSPNDAIVFDATITASDVLVAQTADGSGIVLRVAGTRDQITIQNAIIDPNNVIDNVRFADGTTWSYADLVAKSTAQTADGSGLVLHLAGTTDQITIQNALIDNNRVIENVRFADGTTWSYADLVAKSTAPMDADQILHGSTVLPDILSGGGGNDALY